MDGLFSWESAWPEIGSSTQPGDVFLDQTVIHGAWAQEKGYMIGEAVCPSGYTQASLTTVQL